MFEGGKVHYHSPDVNLWKRLWIFSKYLLFKDWGERVLVQPFLLHPLPICEVLYQSRPNVRLPYSLHTNPFWHNKDIAGIIQVQGYNCGFGMIPAILSNTLNAKLSLMDAPGVFEEDGGPRAAKSVFAVVLLDVLHSQEAVQMFQEKAGPSQTEAPLHQPYIMHLFKALIYQSERIRLTKAATSCGSIVWSYSSILDIKKGLFISPKVLASQYVVYFLYVSIKDILDEIMFTGYHSTNWCTRIC